MTQRYVLPTRTKRAIQEAQILFTEAGLLGKPPQMSRKKRMEKRREAIELLESLPNIYKLIPYKRLMTEVIAENEDILIQTPEEARRSEEEQTKRRNIALIEEVAKLSDIDTHRLIKKAVAFDVFRKAGLYADNGFDEGTDIAADEEIAAYRSEAAQLLSLLPPDMALGYTVEEAHQPPETRENILLEKFDALFTDKKQELIEWGIRNIMPNLREATTVFEKAGTLNPERRASGEELIAAEKRMLELLEYRSYPQPGEDKDEIDHALSFFFEQAPDIDNWPKDAQEWVKGAYAALEEMESAKDDMKNHFARVDIGNYIEWRDVEYADSLPKEKGNQYQEMLTLQSYRKMNNARVKRTIRDIAENMPPPKM